MTEPTIMTPEPCTDVDTIDGAGPRAEECFRHRGASDYETGSFDPRRRDPRAPHLNITTNAANVVAVQYRMSRTPNDYDCKLAQGTHWTIDSEFNVSRLTPKRLNFGLFGFSRQFLPAIATYEWHVCFVIDGTLYRAWRGYDPGPGAALSIDCFIDTERLRAKDTTHYLCSKAEAILNPANYSEYAAYCEPDSCRVFNTKQQYDDWRLLQNPLGEEEQDQIAEAVLIYALTHPQTYLAANVRNFGLYLSVRGRDPSADFLDRVSVGGISFMPGSSLQLKRVGTVVETGGNMLVSVGSFTVSEPGIARGGLSGFCGVLCAGSTEVIVQKQNGRWEVQSFGRTVVQ